MKPILNFLVVIVFTNIAFSQNLSTAPTTEAGMFANARGGSPMLNLVLMDLRSNSAKKNLGETLGSPYSTEKFIKSKVYYGDDLQGDYYVRYNALNSIIEIKRTNLPEEEAKQLYADKNVSIKYLNKEMRFTTYINKKGETKNGYLSLIHDGKKFKLYHRLAVKYSEGKAAANSMVADIPSRFAHFEEYFYQIVGVDRIDYLKSSKSTILKLVGKEKKDQVKSYFKENNVSMDNEEDLIALFSFLNSI